MGTHLRVLSESFLISTNMTGFRCFQKTLGHFALEENTLSIGKVELCISELPLTTCSGNSKNNDVMASIV